MNDNHVWDANFLDKKVGLDGSDAEGALDGEADARAVGTRFDEDSGVWGVNDLDQARFYAGDRQRFEEAFAGRVI